MDKCLVFGAFGYLGFELVQELLQKGLEVIHVDIGDEFEPPEYLEDKEFWVARNANFSVKDVRDIPWEGIDTCIIPACDWVYFAEKERGEIRKRLTQFFAESKDVSVKRVHIQRDDRGEKFLPVELEQTCELTITVPDLYGGWQPPSSSFYKMFVSGEQAEFSPPEDALNVHDAARKILEIITTRKGRFSLKKQTGDQTYTVHRTEGKAGAGNGVTAKEPYDEKEQEVFYIKETENEKEVLKKMRQRVVNLLREK